jgi:hypothetical protein
MAWSPITSTNFLRCLLRTRKYGNNSAGNRCHSLNHMRQPIQNFCSIFRELNSVSSDRNVRIVYYFSAQIFAKERMSQNLSLTRYYLIVIGLRRFSVHKIKTYVLATESVLIYSINNIDIHN